jgi:hypothetical protein
MRQLSILAFISFIMSTTAFANTSLPCDKLQHQLQPILPSQLIMTQHSKTLCILKTTSTGTHYETHQRHYRSWQHRLEKTLKQDGWQTSVEFSADAPFGTQFAMKKKNLIAKIMVSVDGNKTQCPTDQPTDLYSNCHLQPKQRIYLIQINVSKQHA